MYLSPNHRLALFFARKYQKPIYPFNAWVGGLWQSLSEALSLSQSSTSRRLPKLLTPIEQISIFEEIITYSPLEYPLLRKEATAKLVVEAWNLSRQWDLSYPIDPVITSETSEMNHGGSEITRSTTSAMTFERILTRTEDNHVYLQWEAAYREKCRENNWIDEAVILDYLGTAIEQKLLMLPSRMTCIGFGEWTPQQKRFLELCEAQGVQIELRSLLDESGFTESRSNHLRLDLSGSNRSGWDPSGFDQSGHGRNKPARAATLEGVAQLARVGQLGFSNEEEELTVALQSAKSWLNKNSKACIGIIIPNLEQRRFAVLRILDTLCSPKEYNVAAPLSLAQYPMIDAALLALQLMPEEIPFEQFSKLLRLVFFAAGSQDKCHAEMYQAEMCQAAELEIQLRKQVGTHHTLAEYVFFLESIQHRFPKLKDCSLVLRLKQCLELRSGFFGKHSTEYWQNLCRELLNCLGWPGSRILNEAELALKKHWDELLLEYGQLGEVLSDHHYSEALKQIRRLAMHKQFLGQSHHSHHYSIDAPIQVLGLLEGLGFPFDYLWVIGLHRDAWPKEAAPNPFIPLSLQVAHRMPRSSAARELEVAERITQQLSCGAKKVVFSYPTLVLEQVTSISPLIAHFPEVSDQEIHDLRTQFQNQFRAKPRTTLRIESRTEFQTEFASELGNQLCQMPGAMKNRYPLAEIENGPPLVEQESVRGGTNILKLQAICPFRAFAEIRLKASALKNPSLGLSPNERGDILHQILMIFWRGLKNQAALLALTEKQRRDRIDRALNLVFEKWRGLSPASPRSSHSSRFSFTERYLSLERSRMLILVQRFLTLEESRPPFEVLAHEVSQELVLGGVNFKLRIDRIDKLENGDELLIDYKTGHAQVSEWFGTRPLSPQLPLYCIARKTKTSAVAFAIIRPDEVRYKGLKSDEEFCENANEDFSEGSSEKFSKRSSEGSGENTNGELSEKTQEGSSGNRSGMSGIEVSAKFKRYGAEETWALQRLAWEQNLEALALEFKQGHAIVDPLKGEQSCRTCHLNSLCRKNFCS